MSIPMMPRVTKLQKLNPQLEGKFRPSCEGGCCIIYLVDSRNNPIVHSKWFPLISCSSLAFSDLNNQI